MCGVEGGVRERERESVFRDQCAHLRIYILAQHERIHTIHTHVRARGCMCM